MDNKREKMFWCREPFGRFNILSLCYFLIYIYLRPSLHEGLSAHPSLTTEPLELSFKNPNRILTPTYITTSLAFNMKSCQRYLCKASSIHVSPFMGAQAPFLPLSLENYLGSLRFSFSLYKTMLIYVYNPFTKPLGQMYFRIQKFFNF